MRASHVLLSPNGRLKPQPFVYGAVGIYLFGAASHLLTTPGVIRHGGLWPFVAAQILLLWIWFVLHAKRLHDAGRSSGLAAAVALLYVLSLVLLMVVADSFFNTSGDLTDNAAATGALELILLLYVIITLIGSPHYDVAWLMVVALMLIGFAPIVVAVIFSIWAARRPSLAGET
ncbi:MAG: hypothetical protein WA776_10350 [Xanthobacteraceae bacterium]